MLIWYTNLPEEATYYYHRSLHSWKWVSLSLLMFKFIVPFLFLLPRWVKRDMKALTSISILILIMQYVDIYWMVYPHYDSSHIRFGFLEMGTLLGFTSLFLFILFQFLSKYSPIPVKDLGKEESTDHVVHY